MIVVNFSHPLTEDQLAAVVQELGEPLERLIDAPTHFDEESSYADQTARLVNSIGLTPLEWQGNPPIVNLPAYAPITAVLLAHLVGLIGAFPTILRLRPIPDSISPRFELAEIINLSNIRTRSARESRFT